MHPAFYLFVNGINVDLADRRDWQYRAEQWVEDNTDAAADSYSYHAGTFTRWIGQGKRIADVAAMLLDVQPHSAKLIVAAHSNGCAIALAALDKTPELRIDELHLFAAAADPDCDSNGLNHAIAEGRLGQVTCYCSGEDMALKAAKVSNWLLGWTAKVPFLPTLGYDGMGLVGPRNIRPASLSRIKTQWGPGYGHSTWFDEKHFDLTMQRIIGDF